MAYKALYRTYRPQTFDEVVGQKYIVTTIKNQIKENKISHAYLFAGPRGTGKTTMAKLLAKAINCEAEDNRPCNHCTSCNEITNNSHPDVIEIDAATYTKVDDMREIIDKMKYAPTQSKYKVYIIDEVHMLSSSAFNALLKTLEEPPEHVIFILATTEVHKVIPTIISRCQRFDFTVVSDEDVKKRINEVLKNENISIEDEATSMIVDLAEGGLRDALSILDQVIAYSGKNITVSSVKDVYGVLSNKEMNDFLYHVFSSDAIWAIEKAKEFELSGVDIARTTSGLLDILKDLIIMLETSNENLMKRLDVSSSRNLLELVGVKEIYRMVDVLVDTSINYKKTTSSKSLFELAILKMCEICKSNKAKLFGEEVKVSVKEEKEAEVAQIAVESTAKVESPVVKAELDVSSAMDKPVIEEKEVIEMAQEKEPEPVQIPVETTAKVEDEIVVAEPKVEIPLEKGCYRENDRIKTTVEDVINLMVQARKEPIEEAKKQWQLISAFMGNPKYGSIVGSLIGTVPVAATTNALLIAVDSEVEVSLLETARSKKLIREFLKNLLGIPVEYYPITKREFLRLRDQFKEMKINNTLPAAYDIKINTIKIVDNEEDDDEGLNYGKEIFGDAIIVED